jgi:quercetin dioxygenase-like cupin family protein
MILKRAGSQPSLRGPAEWFTGTVRIDPLHTAEAPARVGAASVTFEPGARTAWHTHPLGQTLHVLYGVGRVQAKGGPIREIRAGDTVWIPPGEKHWHGAGPNTRMVHIAMQEALDGKHVEWMEYVTDEEYAQPVGG